VSPLRCLRLVTCLAVAAAGCAGTPRFTWVQELPPEAASEDRIHPGDTILVEVKDQTAASGEFVVRPDGHYPQPIAGSVPVAGLSPAQAAALVTERLRNTFVNTPVRVWIVRPAPIRVSVLGQVRSAGAYELPRQRTVVAAIASAGGLNEFARDDQIFVIRNDSAEPRVRFRMRDLTAPEPRSAAFQLRDGDIVLVE